MAASAVAEVVPVAVAAAVVFKNVLEKHLLRQVLFCILAPVGGCSYLAEMISVQAIKWCTDYFAFMLAKYPII